MLRIRKLLMKSDAVKFGNYILKNTIPAGGGKWLLTREYLHNMKLKKEYTSNQLYKRFLKEMKKQKQKQTQKPKPIHFLGEQSTTKCGWTLYTGGIIVNNTTKDKTKVNCKHCLRKIKILI